MKTNTKSKLISSLLVLCLCVTMFAGATYAWFTDTVTSAGNIIKSGTLDVEMQWADGKADPTADTTEWKDASNGAIFNYDKWEPGYAEVRHVRIANKGNLALKYQLNILETGKVTSLADVIDVYYADPAVRVADRNAVNQMYKQGVLSAVLAGMETSATGNLQPGESVTVTLALKMQESAGNEYQNMSIGSEFAVSLFATQLASEKDSFDETYDADAWDGEADTDLDVDTNVYTISTAAELAGLAELVNEGETFSGKTVKLTANIDLAGLPWEPIGNSTTSFNGIFDGQGHTISNLVVDGYDSNSGLFGMTQNGEIKNLTVHNANISGRLNVAVVAGTPYTSKYTNIKVTGHVEVNGMSYVGAVGGKNAYANWTDVTITVDDTSYIKANSIENGTAYRTYVGGAFGFAGEGGHTFTNITSNIDVIGSTCDVGGIAGIAHYNNSFINCSSSGDVIITDAAEAADAEEIGGIAGVWHNQNGTKVTFENCTFTGTLTTNITEGVDLSDNTITGKAYSASGTGELIIISSEAVESADELKEALEAGGEITLAGNIDLAGTQETIIVPADKKVTLDLQNHSLTSGKENLCIEVEGEMTIKNGTLSKEPYTGEYPSVPPVPVSVKGGTLTLENVTVNANGTTYDAGITLNTGTLNLNEGTVINVNGTAGETYGIWVLGFKNNTINFNGGEIIVAAPADVDAVGICSFGPITINANSGAISVNAGADHYGIYSRSPVTMTVKPGFMFNIAVGAQKDNGSLTIN